MSDCVNSRIGNILPGQGWVELHGMFTLDELEALIEDINERYTKATTNDDTDG